MWEGVRSLDEVDGAERWAELGETRCEVTSGPPCLELVMKKQDRITQWKSPCWEWTEASEDLGEGKAEMDKKLWGQRGGDPLSRIQGQ